MTTRKRILHIIPTLECRGAGKQLALLAAGLSGDEFEVHVCGLAHGGPLEAQLAKRQIPVTVIGQRFQLDPAAYLRLKRYIARLQPDLVHTWRFAANMVGRIAARRAGVQHLVSTARTIDPWKPWHQWVVDRRLANSTAAIVVNSPGVRNYYVRHGIAAEKFRVIPDGVEPALPSPLTREQLLAELGLPASARLIGAVGRLAPHKRIKDLIWAADLLKVIRDDVYLLIIGDGPQRARLERFCDCCRNADKVHFLGRRDDLPRMMRHFDLLWLASQYEGLPGAILQAMAAGVPVVATDIPGNRDLVVPGETGYLTSVGDRAALARYANKILNDPTLASRLGAAARARAEQEFSVARMIEGHAALYRELLIQE